MPRYNAEKICLLRTSAIGDVVHAMYLAQCLRSGYPTSEITWVTQDIPGALIRGQPSVDRVLTFSRHMGWRGWLELRYILKKECYDLLVVPQVSAKVSLLASWIRSTIKLGFDFHRARELSWLVTNRRIPAGPRGHVLDQFMEFVDYLGIQHGAPEWNFHFSFEEIEWKQNWQKQFCKPICALVPASSNPEKDWPSDRFVELADRISTDTDMEPVIICGPGRRETEMARYIREGARCKPEIASEKPIRHTLLQLACSRVVIAPDTGPLHMAVALGVPTIGLYGYSNPRRCGPYYFRHLVIDKFNDSPDAPEPVSNRTKPGRMSLITVGEVMQKINIA
ncbi:glycosyltransferase family 9 protein [bacterium]|nr:glycosyltransferase family 9 protein [candidate division CSSED10-310 bacterium]